jgi:outer membrane protein
MKSGSLILNIILLAAVAYLYVLHFRDKKPEAATSSIALPAATGAAGILYVNSDSLLDKYEYYKSKKAEFTATREKIKAELKSEGEKLQNDIQKYQQEGASMTEAQRGQKEEELGMRQQQLMQKKEDLISKLDEQQDKSIEELYTRLNEYLKKNKIKNCNYVLGFQKGGGILYANDSLNITKQVVEGLNKEYIEEKK